MPTTLVLEIATPDGLACWRGLDRTEYQATPPASFADVQDGRIPVDVAHQGPPLGFVDFLEETVAGLHAVAVIDDVFELDELRTLQCSPKLRANAMLSIDRYSYGYDRTVRTSGQLDATRTLLDSVALVDRTAAVTGSRVQAFAGSYREMTEWDRNRLPSIVQRAGKAATWQLRYSRPASIQIHRPQRRSEYEVRGGARPEVLHHPGGRVLSVR